MYLRNNPSQTGYSGNDQVAGGLFLIVFGGCGSPVLDGDHYDVYEIDDPKKPGIKRTLPKLYACVRSVRLRQMGHWMMGGVTLAGNYFSVSGGLGNDGLPHDWKLMFQSEPPSKEYPSGRWDHRRLMKEEVQHLKDNYLTQIPEEISTAYHLDETGHNSVGAAPAKLLRKWAMENLKALQRRPRGKKKDNGKQEAKAQA
jgi:hypothetical protein